MPDFSIQRRRLVVGGTLAPLFTAMPALRAMAATAPAATGQAQYQLKPDIVVAIDGSGQFTSIHAALQSIPVGNRERVVILVRNGFYDEAVRVDAAYVTLRGESRMGTRLQMDRPNEGHKYELGPGVLNISPTAHDFVLESMTVHNTVKAIGPHAFAVMGRADRTIIQHADLLSLGADTLSLWRTNKTPQEAGLSEGPGATPLWPDGGRYYHTGLRVTGSVDFVCPRGWCYMRDSEIVQVNPRAEAAVWHDGSRNQDKKFVMKGCTFDGPVNFPLARHHRDAQLYFIDCSFSERMRDRAPYMVIYPTNGGPPSQADLDRNKTAAAEYTWGERSYFYDSHRAAGDYAWHADNLRQAAGNPAPATIDAAWTFRGSWNPERADGPQVTRLRADGATISLTFDRLVTVRGMPRIVAGGSVGNYRSGSGTNTLLFDAIAGDPQRLSFADGAIIGSEGVAQLVFAKTELPRLKN